MSTDPDLRVSEPTSEHASAVRAPIPNVRPLERGGVAALSLLQALIWGWAGWVLPWQGFTVFAVSASLVALAHVLTALTAVLFARWFIQAWRLASYLAVAQCLLCAWIAISSGYYLSRLYGHLGEGVFAILLAIWGLAVLTTLPLAVWGLARTRAQKSRLARRAEQAALLLLSGSLLTFIGYYHSLFSDSVRPLPPHAGELAQLGRVIPFLPPSNVTERGSVKEIARCTSAPIEQPITVLAVYQRASDGKPQAVCKQGAELATLLTDLRHDLAGSAARAPVALDIVDGVSDLNTAPSWLQAFAVRPGLDGVCLSGRCLTPWQLLGRSTFVSHAPIAFFPEVKFGVSPKQVKRWLKGDSETVPYQRLSTQSYVLNVDGSVTALRRMQAYREEPSLAGVQKAQQLFEAHILAAQQTDGRFRYTLDPFTGKADTENFSLPRQAGTAYALCDVGSDRPAVTLAARAALTLLTQHQRDTKDATLAGIAFPNEPYLALGPSALALVALLQCRSRVGAEFDANISRLARFVQHLQAPDGSFFPGYYLERATFVKGPQALYALGQATLALILLEAEQHRDAKLQVLEPELLRQAIDRAMAYTSESYWQRAMYPFFFLEENWHCVAARSALPLHRNANYEQFCLDYVRFKSRLILDRDSDVDPELIGAFGLGNIIPPHSAGAAGFGEALAAALAVERARGEHSLRDEDLLREIVGLVLRQQWTEASLFAIVPEAVGSFSEQVHAPTTRIDFAQHAWAALSHAREELQW